MPIRRAVTHTAVALAGEDAVTTITSLASFDGLPWNYFRKVLSPGLQVTSYPERRTHPGVYVCGHCISPFSNNLISFFYFKGRLPGEKHEAWSCCGAAARDAIGCEHDPTPKGGWQLEGFDVDVD